jgi:ribosomal protein L37AE/L43A
MKLTERTEPQAKNYQCDKCKAIKCHKNMHDDLWCNDCYDQINELAKELK